MYKEKPSSSITPLKTSCGTSCVSAIACYDDHYAKYIEHGTTHGPHCFNTDMQQWLKNLISVIELCWAIGTLAFSTTLLTISFVDCAFWAKLVYFTWWGNIASTIYYLLRLIANVYNRYIQKYKWLLIPPSIHVKPYQMSPIGILLWGFTMQFQLITWTWESFILPLYFFGGGSQVSFDFLSVGAHLVLPILIWLDIWVSAIPFPIEHVYKIPFYAELYAVFGVIHYYNDWGHLGTVPAPCEPSYAYSIAQLQFWVYEKVNYANSLTTLFVCLGIVIVGPAYGFITYYLKKCFES